MLNKHLKYSETAEIANLHFTGHHPNQTIFQDAVSSIHVGEMQSSLLTSWCQSFGDVSLYVCSLYFEFSLGC